MLYQPTILSPRNQAVDATNEDDMKFKIQLNRK